MLIVSKFHDYYDTAMGQGIDKTVVYQRTTDVAHWDRHYVDPAHSVPYRVPVGDDRIELVCHELGFCGEWRPFVVARLTYSSPLTFLPRVFYSPALLACFMQDVGFVDNSKRMRGAEGRPALIRSDAGREEYFKLYKDEALFIQHKCPVILRHVGENAWDRCPKEQYILNPRLADWQFQKVKDPFQAFQDIYMYISGVLGVGAREIVTISDKDKIHKHGFDAQSFRKAPTKRIGR